MDVTILVSTFGERHWQLLARQRAIPSAERFDVPVVHVHGESLHEARNEAVARAETEWVCHLDADDQLEDGYFDAAAVSDADLRVPAVRYITKRSPPAAYMPAVYGHNHFCEPECLREGNWLVVGTVARKELIESVGGWRDWPVYEDYDLWVRCWLAGATIEAVPGAVYRAHVRNDSRNRGTLTGEQKRAVHQSIAREHGLVVPA